MNVVGPSASNGKSTLINDTLFPILTRHFYRATTSPLPYGDISGLEHIDKVIEIDQAPIGRTPRSNPVTYTGVFTLIRDFFTQLPESKIRGYKQGRFSFNVPGGRCEECEGAGLKKIEESKKIILTDITKLEGSVTKLTEAVNVSGIEVSEIKKLESIKESIEATINKLKRDYIALDLSKKK